jgi:hypothetical protein
MSVVVSYFFITISVMYQLVLAYLIFGGDFDLNNFNKISSFNYIFYSQNLNSRFNLSLKNLSSLQLIRTNVMLVIVILVFFFFLANGVQMVSRGSSVPP